MLTNYHHRQDRLKLNLLIKYLSTVRNNYKLKLLLPSPSLLSAVQCPLFPRLPPTCHHLGCRARPCLGVGPLELAGATPASHYTMLSSRHPCCTIFCQYRKIINIFRQMSKAFTVWNQPLNSMVYFNPFIKSIWEQTIEWTVLW